jgi:hypothetical protein
MTSGKQTAYRWVVRDADRYETVKQLIDDLYIFSEKNASISFTTEGYNSDEVSITIRYSEPETDEEYQTRINTAAELKKRKAADARARKAEREKLELDLLNKSLGKYELVDGQFVPRRKK